MVLKIPVLNDDATHTYATAGTHIVSITGAFPRIYFAKDRNNAYAFKLYEVVQWGDNLWTSMEGTFTKCSNLSITATDVPDLSAVTNMSGMFASSGVNQDLSSWNVGNVRDMSNMFSDGFAFNQDLSNWDVGNVTNMLGMFSGATSFNQDLSNWDVGNVTNMLGMFLEAASFNQDLSSWNVGNVTNMEWMFVGATSFDQDLSNWNVGNVTNMYAMFSNATSFNGDLAGWNVENVTDMGFMFYEATSFNRDLSSWDVGNVINMIQMFTRATSFNGDLSSWNVSTVEDMGGMFISTPFNQDISSWNVGSVWYMWEMFSGATSFDQDISNWNVGNVEDMSNMFKDATAFNQNLSRWDVSSVTDMGEMFSGATSFDQDLGDWDIGSIVDSGFSLGMRNMFVSTGLSAANYDAALIGWSTDTSGSPNDNDDDIPSDIKFHAGDSQYCAVDERGILTGTYSWEITDGGTHSSCSISEPFITKWQTTGPNGSITIPTTGTGYYYSVDWGDGTGDTGLTDDATHTYATANTYTVSITGVFPRIYFTKDINGAYNFKTL